ncbi:hypothetical protein [Streptomyces soliscabiei]|uniref:hypothetical protein n=1 Tax=Streptomyces soliscabiei TaxID=588897 RepID=UPI0029B73300|nr:hypothetical protein [Streptomyces sp. NY05-11A]MDX2680402.1 hypothetical protein [Streptomyces sp. NY05-11A]
MLYMAMAAAGLLERGSVVGTDDVQASVVVHGQALAVLQRESVVSGPVATAARRAYLDRLTVAEQTGNGGVAAKAARCAHLGAELLSSDDHFAGVLLGTATVRSGLKPGRYPVTIVGHHGRVKKTEYVTVTAR